MRTWYLLPCALLAAACSGQDVDIGHGSIASGATTGVDAAGTMKPIGNPALPEPPSAIVIRSVDLPFSGSSSSGSSSSGSVVAGATSGSSAGTGSGGSTIDPEMRYLFIGNGPPTCGDPSAGSLCDFFRVTIRIPSLLYVTGVRSLQDPRLQGTYSLRGPDRGGGDCAGSGGDFVDGTLEIVDVAGPVTVRLANTLKVGFDADGSYTVAECP